MHFVVSSQRQYHLSPQLQHPLLPLGNIPQYLSRWERIVSYKPADTRVFNVEIHVFIELRLYIGLCWSPYQRFYDTQLAALNNVSSREITNISPDLS
jgi:hypothetical protein